MSYLEAFDQHTAGLRFITTNGEPHFSWSGCELCGSPVGGMKEDWSAIDGDGARVKGSNACVDCVVFVANGECLRYPAST